MEGSGTGLVGRLWKVGRRGMAYAEGRELVERILSASGQTPVVAEDSGVVGNSAARPAKARKELVESLLPGMVAVYSDRRGRPFAWQVTFDVQYWDTVSALVNGDAA